VVEVEQGRGFFVVLLFLFFNKGGWFSPRVV
jgi:hypothetical protein